MDRPQHRAHDWLPEGKRRGERRERPEGFHPSRSETISIQPDKHWHTFECNLEDTAERRGGARMDL